MDAPATHSVNDAGMSCRSLHEPIAFTPTHAPAAARASDTYAAMSDSARLWP